jgi:hypothetical protein
MAFMNAIGKSGSPEETLADVGAAPNEQAK